MQRVTLDPKTRILHTLETRETLLYISLLNIFVFYDKIVFCIIWNDSYIRSHQSPTGVARNYGLRL